ncbi:hypothetical protein KCP69_18485 [Salmonella enterica subsp. enterica]|nr:hypothetical protein KCP69_18485 [Salmonella enterica subsp. enterica]
MWRMCRMAIPPACDGNRGRSRSMSRMPMLPIMAQNAALPLPGAARKPRNKTGRSPRCRELWCRTNPGTDVRRTLRAAIGLSPGYRGAERLTATTKSSPRKRSLLRQRAGEGKIRVPAAFRFEENSARTTPLR